MSSQHLWPQCKNQWATCDKCGRNGHMTKSCQAHTMVKANVAAPAAAADSAAPHNSAAPNYDAAYANSAYVMQVTANAEGTEPPVKDADGFPGSSEPTPDCHM